MQPPPVPAHCAPHQWLQHSRRGCPVEASTTWPTEIMHILIILITQSNFNGTIHVSIINMTKRKALSKLPNYNTIIVHIVERSVLMLWIMDFFTMKNFSCLLAIMPGDTTKVASDLTMNISTSQIWSRWRGNRHG